MLSVSTRLLHSTTYQTPFLFQFQILAPGHEREALFRETKASFLARRRSEGQFEVKQNEPGAGKLFWPAEVSPSS